MPYESSLYLQATANYVPAGCYQSLCCVGKLVCMLTSEALLSKTVIAAHLYKSSWAVFVELALCFSDIDDVRNGLLLWKPIEHAFDTAQMCFTYDSQNNRYDKMSSSQSVGSCFFKYILKCTQHT